MTQTAPKTRTVRLIRKSPVAWLNLQLLVDTGILAAVSSVTGNRSPRREVLAALDVASPMPKDYFDYSGENDDEVWIDFVADLGDGFNATHSIAWLVGRDYLGLGAVAEPIEQPYPPSETRECGPDAFGKAEHVLKAGQITIFGGDLVYPYATQTEYEDRTVGPYHAARPWQLDGKANPKPGSRSGRRLFSIPGNHDWYDGLAAFVQRFCQPGRWMGCWQVQQRRSYFAIKLPHRVWLWGVDLATADDFDAPQLEYFSARAKDLKDGDAVILCVPKPAWVDRAVEEGTGPDDKKPPRSWESWKKVEVIKKLVDDQHGPHIRAILSGDLHHYSRYETLDADPGKTHLITCGGGGAFLLGTDALPKQVLIGDRLHAELQAAFPTPDESRSFCWGVIKLPFKHWKICSVLGIVMMCLVWFLESAVSGSFVTAGAIFSTEFAHAFFAALFSSPVPLALLGLLLLGFCAFARSGADGKTGRAALAGVIHGLAQLVIAIILARHAVVPILTMDASLAVKVLALLVASFFFAWLIPGLLLSLYLLAANVTLGLHRQEVFSAQAIDDLKAFLRIRVSDDGIAVYPVGLRQISRSWRRAGGQEGTRETKSKGLLKGLAQAAMSPLVTPEEEIEVRTGATHLLVPEHKLAPHLIEGPIIIPRSKRSM